MKSLRLRATLIALAMAGAALAACSSTWVVVPPPADGYSSADTLRGYLDGDEVRVVFRFDTITSTRVVTRTDTVFTEGADTVFQVRELLRVDTVAVTDTVRLSNTMIRIDSILRVDTVQVPVTDTVRVAVTDTVRVAMTDTVRIAVTDTIRVAVTDTVVRTDTVRVAVTDTVTIPGRRFLFVPPGHYPPDGECRVWVHGAPPGQQARAARCDSLGPVPARAFILFGGDAWDFDYDWLAAVERGEDAPPPEILALKRKGQAR